MMENRSLECYGEDIVLSFIQQGAPDLRYSTTRYAAETAIMLQSILR